MLVNLDKKITKTCRFCGNQRLTYASQNDEHIFVSVVIFQELPMRAIASRWMQSEYPTSKISS